MDGGAANQFGMQLPSPIDGEEVLERAPCSRPGR